MPMLYTGMSMTEFLNKTKRMSKIKTIAEYQQLASRTCTNLTGEHANDRHMNLGVITEIGEVLDIFKKNLAYNKPMDLVNLGEELADISWYITNKCKFSNLILDLDFEDVLKDVGNTVNNQLFVVNDLPVDVKAEAILTLILSCYCMPTDNMFNAPAVQLGLLAIIADWYGLDYFQCLTNNIDKLKVRYPEKFTEEAAQNRNLDSERAELEK